MSAIREFAAASAEAATVGASGRGGRARSAARGTGEGRSIVRPAPARCLALHLFGGSRHAAPSAAEPQARPQAAPTGETRETMLVRHEDVPDGTETCTAERVRDASDPERVVHTAKRTCAPNTKRVEVPCLALETADVRKRARDAGTRACTARFCLASHGNVSCGSEE